MRETPVSEVGHLLDIDDRHPEAIVRLVDLAARIKRGDHGIHLPGRTLALLFEQPSTRTRASFEAGINRLGGSAMFLGPGDTQLARGEPIKDTARALSRYVDAVAIRTADHADLEAFAAHADVPVINALSDRAHPCQALADLLTIRESIGPFDEVTAVWVGDGNNVGASFALAAAAVGIDLTVVTPPAHELAPDVVERAAALGDAPRTAHAPHPWVERADVVYTDTWVSMSEEDHDADREAKVAAFDGYQVNHDLLEGSDARVMHCLPAHRGEEVTDAILEDDRALIWDQAENRMHVQNALLASLLDDDLPDLVGQRHLPLGDASAPGD
ncbi:MAG: ornithine carbamoyltransferase [Halobacteriota archaeon]